MLALPEAFKKEINISRRKRRDMKTFLTNQRKFFKEAKICFFKPFF